MKFEKIKDQEELLELGLDPEIIKYPATVNKIMRDGVKATANGKSFYLHKILKSNLDKLKDGVLKKWDGVVLLDGMEGSGKTGLSAGASFYLSDGKLSLNDVLYTPKQVEEWIDTAEPLSVGIIDEFALMGLNSDYMGKIQKTIIKRLTIMRSKQLIIFIVLPYLFMLSKYFAIGRTRFLLHSYSPNGRERGFFKFYSYNEKKNLFLRGKTNWDYNVQKPAFTGFHLDNLNGRFWNPEDYEARKQKFTKEALEEQDKDTMRDATVKAVLHLNKIGLRCKTCEKKTKYTHKEIGYLFGYSQQHITRLIKVDSSIS